jgi:hypothetical protein
MVPVVALSVLGVVGVVQRYRDAGAQSGVVTQVGRVERSLDLYAGLVDERSGSESLVIGAGLHVSPAEVSRLAGYDVEAELRSARTAVDTAIAAGGGTVLASIHRFGGGIAGLGVAVLGEAFCGGVCVSRAVKARGFRVWSAFGGAFGYGFAPSLSLV